MKGGKRIRKKVKLGMHGCGARESVRRGVAAKQERSGLVGVGVDAWMGGVARVERGGVKSERERQIK